MTPALRVMLDEAKLFAVTVVTAPPAGGDLTAFRPDFAKYRAVVLNYDAPDERWPASLKSSFEQYVSSGGGVVAVHAANNAFPSWPAYNEMMGVGGWRRPRGEGRSLLVLPRGQGRLGPVARQRGQPRQAHPISGDGPHARPSDRQRPAADLDARRRRTLCAPSRAGAEHDCRDRYSDPAPAAAWTNRS
jgi:hypothetical protein